MMPAWSTCTSMSSPIAHSKAISSPSFLDGRGLDAAMMQTIAREMNFSESTFILPRRAALTPTSACASSRPASELPMAGHPTIGSTFALAHLGVIAARARPISCSGWVSVRRASS